MAHDHEDHDHDHGRAGPPPAPTSRPPVDRAAIVGWGADLDHRNRPAYPMERMPQRLEVPATPPAQQVRHVEVLVSPERPAITPLFGSPNPPRGMSGALRRFAFGMTENDVRHWLVLMLADRVDVVEGLVEDLAGGHVPNIPAEMGIRAAWQHDKAGLAKKAALGAAVIGIAYYLRSRRR